MRACREHRANDASYFAATYLRNLLQLQAMISFMFVSPFGCAFTGVQQLSTAASHRLALSTEKASEVATKQDERASLLAAHRHLIV